MGSGPTAPRSSSDVRTIGFVAILVMTAGSLGGVDVAGGAAPGPIGDRTTASEAGQDAPVAPAAAAPETAEPPSSTIPWVLAAAGLVVMVVAARTRAWRVPDAIGPPPLRSPLVGVGIFLLLLLAGILGVGLASSAGSGGETWSFDATRQELVPQPTTPSSDGSRELEAAAMAMLGMVVGQGIVILWWVLVVPRTADRDVRSAIGDRETITTQRALAFGAAAMLLAYPILSTFGLVAMSIEVAWRGGEFDPIAHGTLRTIQDGGGLFTSGWAILIGVLVVTGVPICEEFAYRGLLQRTIVRCFDGGVAMSPGARRWVGIALASGVFTLMHWSALPEASRGSSLALLFGVSMVLGWSYERTGRLAAPIAGHALFNAINLGVAMAAN